MKNILVLFFFAFCFTTANAQFRMVSDGSVDDVVFVNDSTYTVTCAFFNDLTGKNYLPTQIQTGFHLITSSQQLYRITTSNGTFSDATMTIVEVDNSAVNTENSPNLGQVQVFQYTNGSDFIPQSVIASNGLTFQLQSAIASYNAKIKATGNGSTTATLLPIYKDFNEATAAGLQPGQRFEIGRNSTVGIRGMTLKIPEN